MGLFDRIRFSANSTNSTKTHSSSEPDITHLIELGHVHEANGRIHDALQSYLEALRIAPSSARAHLNYGNAMLAMGDLNGALEAFDTALKYKPDYPGAFYNIGNALLSNGRYGEAVVNYRKALDFKADYADVHCALGIALNKLGQYDEAVCSYQRALEINPRLVEAYYNLGSIFKSQQRLDSALASFRRAVELKPDFSAAQMAFAETLSAKQQAVSAYNLGLNQQHSGNFQTAIASYNNSLASQPDLLEAHNNLGLVLLEIGQIDGAIASFRAALHFKNDFYDARNNLLLALNYSYQDSPSSYLQEALQFGQSVSDTVSNKYTDWSCPAKPERLRVGLVSGDFRIHSVGFFLLGLLSHLDPARIQLYAYSTNDLSDSLTKQLKPFFAYWRSLSDMSDTDAAQVIHADGIHILIDLSGHTAHNRLSVFASKPAPVQVSWLGLPATTGILEMDYILGDSVAIPENHEDHFSETVWRLPDCYVCFSAPEPTVQVSPLPASLNGYVTFGSFNNLTKMNDTVVALWSNILKAIPDSRLYLKTAQLKNDQLRIMTEQRFLDHGISADRLVLAGTLDIAADHLAEYNKVDIALDTFPYPGVTTSIEALWMGVPVLSLHGDRFLALSAKTIAIHAGLSDWVAVDHEDYVAKAVHHAANLSQLAGLRAGLRQQVMDSPLFDSPHFARSFENALWDMWGNSNTEK